MFPIRVFNASVFYLRAIASPVNSAQFRAIQEQLRATEFQLETLVSIKRFSLFKLFSHHILIKTFCSYTYITRSIMLYCMSLGNPIFWQQSLIFICYKIKKNFSMHLIIIFGTTFIFKIKKT